MYLIQASVWTSVLPRIKSNAALCIIQPPVVLSISCYVHSTVSSSSGFQDCHAPSPSPQVVHPAPRMRASIAWLTLSRTSVEKRCWRPSLAASSGRRATPHPGRSRHNTSLAHSEQLPALVNETDRFTFCSDNSQCVQVFAVWVLY